MFLERKQDLSIFYWLQDTVFSAYSMVTVVDGYPEQDMELPVVAVVNNPIRLEPHELGNRTGQRVRSWTLEVYANNKAQRDEMASVIMGDIENGIPVHDYDEGFPPSVSPTQIGTMETFGIIVIPQRIFPDLVEKLYWKVSVRFSTNYETI
jgi:hypothetical protein